MNWTVKGLFNWDWTPRIPSVRNEVCQASFLKMPDGRMLCLSDEFLMGAAQGLSKDYVISNVVSGARYADLNDDLKRAFDGLFEEMSVSVCAIQKALPEQEPTLRELLEVTQKDYVPYFLASCFRSITCGGPDALLTDLQRLEPSRFAEYDKILNEKCADVLDGSDPRYLTMRDLWLAKDVKPDDSAFVERWKAQLSSEILKDYYFYGQNPYERIHLLRFGVHLAISGENSLYERVLGACVKALNGETVYGPFDLENW